jgi:hypothetical protein
MMPRQVSDFWGFEPMILAVVPATLPLRYALKEENTYKSATEIILEITMNLKNQYNIFII